MLTSIFTDSSFSFLFRKGHKKKKKKKRSNRRSWSFCSLSLFSFSSKFTSWCR